MQTLFFKTLFTIFLIALYLPVLGSTLPLDFSISNSYEKYQAVVLGKITKQKVNKSGKVYITEYKLKAVKWLYKKPSVKKTKYVTIKVLGAELPDKGIVIKASTTPSYIPINKEAIFLLEQNKLKQKNIFTLSSNGIIYGNNTSSLSVKQIKDLFNQIEEL